MAKPKMRIYYAHSVGIYDSEQEKRDVQTLRSLGFDVFNPKNKSLDKAYKKYGMTAFKHAVQVQCDALAFRANPDASISAGVAQEVAWAREAELPVIELPSCLTSRTLSVDSTREFIREQGSR